MQILRSLNLLGVLWLLACAALIPDLSGQTSRQLAEGWEFYRGGLGSTWEIWRGEQASDNVPWAPVTLPHCYNARDAVDPDARYYQGPAWYRTRLQVDNPYAGGRTLLHFDGVGQRARVYVGRELAGEHVGGYDGWTVDLTEAVVRARGGAEKTSSVPLAVGCDNSRDAETLPSDLSDFTRYGGLYRHVTLEYVPAISLERVHVTARLAPDGTAHVEVAGRMRNPRALSDETDIRIEVFDPQGRRVAKHSKPHAPGSGEAALAAFDLASPQLWSPRTPSLYRCLVTLKSRHGEQVVQERFGVRTFEWVEHGPFKLNGERLLLRGSHYHEDHAGVGAAVPDEVVRQTLRAMKDMGANFVRLGHYQQAPLVLEMCDELGLLVWEEIPWCRGGLGGPAYRKQAREMLANMIDQHRNHASVMLWGLGNENDWPGDFEIFEKAEIRAFMQELNALAHQLDPTRKTTIRRCDFCKDVVDVYSPSIWAGWYRGRYTEYRKSTEREIAATPRFFHAEYGGDSHAGRHAEEPEKFLGEITTGQGTEEIGKAYKNQGGEARASRDGDWSESYIVNLFDWHLKEQEQMPDLTGAAQWVFKDFATPLRPENPVPYVNQKGVLERDGTPKESYYLFQSYWADAPMLHIYGHTWPVRWGKVNEEKLVKVFSNCAEVELFLNGVSAGVRRRDSADFPAAGLRWKVRFLEGENRLSAKARRDGREIEDAVTFSYQTAIWEKPARLELREISRRDAVVLIEARVFDANGVACLDAAQTVRFGLAGDGRLLDNLGTAKGSRVVQFANGRARIEVELAGSAVASVQCAGLPTEFVVLKR